MYAYIKYYTLSFESVIEVSVRSYADINTNYPTSSNGNKVSTGGDEHPEASLEIDISMSFPGRGWGFAFIFFYIRRHH